MGKSGRLNFLYSLFQKRESFFASVWFFPCLIVFFLLLLTTLNLNGSSIGIYHQLLYGNDTRDTSLVLGQPRGVRSDEWLVNTQMVMAQDASNYPVVNKNIGNGQNMSLAIDVPYKDWSVIFKPQNLAFFILPFEFAFAFKWWLMAALLITSVYFFALKLLPGKRLISSLLALSLYFSPFVQWWYQASTLITFAFALYIATLLIVFIKNEASSRKQKIIYALLLAYCTAVFIMQLYPPYQIALAIAVGIFTAGYGLNHRATLKRINVFIVAGSVLAAILISLAFLLTRIDAIQALSDTVYPGNRVVQNGGFSFSQLFGNGLSGYLQSDSRAKGYPLNQSEASNFILIIPFLFLTGCYIVVREWRNKAKVEWEFLSVIIVSCLLALKLFVTHGNTLSHLLLLDRVPHNRAIIATGFLNLVFILLIVAYVRRTSLNKYAVTASVALGLVFSVYASLKIHKLYPGFSPSIAVSIAFCAYLALVAALLQYKKTVIGGLTLLLAFSVASTAGINPVYRGVGNLAQNPLSEAIKSTPKTAKWAVADFRAFENYPLVFGRQTISGVYAYPQLDLWKVFNKNPTDQDVYNRYAHVIFNVSPTPSREDKIELGADDFFVVNASPCSIKLQSLGITHIITASKVTSPCIAGQQEIISPELKFYISRIGQNND